LPSIQSLRKSKNVFWWETKFWGNDIITVEKGKNLVATKKTKPIDKDDIIDVLINAYKLLQRSLAAAIQSNVGFSFDTEISSLAIIQFMRSVEIIHRVDDKNFGFSLSKKAESQLNPLGFSYFERLRDIRNLATHDFIADFNSISRFFEMLYDYLTVNIFNEEILEKFENNIEEPIDGMYYTSEIESFDSKRGLYFLKNPDLDLSGRTNILLSYKKNNHLEIDKLETGKKIRFKLKIVINDNLTNFYADSAELSE